MKKIISSSAVLLILFLLSGCSSSGSGNYGQQYQLNKTWILQNLGGKTADNSNFPNGLPWMTLDVGAASMTGNNGCNSMTGGIHASGNKIIFTNIASTRMYCDGVDDQKFTDALLKANDWAIEGDRLFIEYGEVVLAVFKEGSAPETGN